jgi:hypothetical protein
VNGRGYRVDTFGNVLNLKDEVMVPKHDLRHDDELPVPLSTHMFNFNATDVLGNSATDESPQCPPADKNKRKVNKYNFLCDNNGHIINRNRRKILDKAYLDKTGDFPSLLNYKGTKFHIKDVIGSLYRDAKTGHAVVKRDRPAK